MASKEKWQNNLSNITERIEYLYNNKDMSDFNFIVGSTESIIPGHKFVFSVTSEIFYNMFYMMQTENTDIHVPNIPCLSFLEFLSYVYKDKLTLNTNNINDIIQLAMDYDICDLKIRCIEFLKINLTYETMITTLQTSIKFGLMDVQEKCLELIGENSKQLFVSSNEFLNIDKTTLKIILQSDYFKCTEYEIFLALNKWIEHYCNKNKITKDTPERKEMNNSLFKLIRFETMPLDEFKMCTTHNVLSVEHIGTIFQNIVLDKQNSKSRYFTKFEKIHPMIVAKRFKTNKKTFYINNVNAKTDLYFTANEPIYFCGIGIYGPTVEGCKILDRQDILAEIQDADSNVLAYHKEFIVYDGTNKLYEIVFNDKILLKANSEYLVIIRRVGANNVDIEHFSGTSGEEKLCINNIEINFKEHKNMRYDQFSTSRLAAIIFRNS